MSIVKDKLTLDAYEKALSALFRAQFILSQSFPANSELMQYMDCSIYELQKLKPTLVDK